MTVRIEAPVGLRNRVTNVTNNSADQAVVIGLLAVIPIGQGGKRELWPVPPLPGPDGQCAPSLVDAIFEFQVFWQAVGLLTVADGVVDPDKTTLARMNDLADAAPTLSVDVIVKFQGTLGQPVELVSEEVYPAALLALYLAQPNRRLIRIGKTTTTIRGDSAPLLADFVNRIKQAAVGARLGAVFVYGSSSGGRNAVDLAVALTQEGLPVHHVAALDGAWFPDESLTQPDNAFGEPTALPLFRPSGPVSAPIRESWFQTRGNHSELTFQGVLFTSAMSGKEVHGAIEGFTSLDLTTQVNAVSPATDDDAHITLSKLATPLLHARIAGVLNSL